mgnify:CR=1 FL=1|tara:strand:- start:119 stop:904 length:786 start_codon:yes stop_codon:yes gene_type:complete
MKKSIFTDSEILSYFNEGYIIRDNFFSDEEIYILQSETEKLFKAGKFKNVATKEDGSESFSKKNLQLIPLFEHSRIFRSLPYQKKVIKAISELIGDPYILHTDQIFFKPANIGLGTSWHQDNSYFKIDDPLKGVALWIAINDANLENGALKLIPGMHMKLLYHERDPNSDHHIRCFPQEDNAIAVELKAGGVIFFCYGVPHCTGANISNKDRAGLAYHYIHEDFFTKKVNCYPNYCRYITGEKSSGGRNEYGLEVEGEFFK